MTQSKIELGKLVELLSKERHSLKEAEARITQEFSEKIKTELPELDIVLRETKRRGEIAQVTQGYGTPGSTAATIAVVGRIIKCDYPITGIVGLQSRDVVIVERTSFAVGAPRAVQLGRGQHAFRDQSQQVRWIRSVIILVDLERDPYVAKR